LSAICGTQNRFLAKKSSVKNRKKRLLRAKKGEAIKKILADFPSKKSPDLATPKLRFPAKQEQKKAPKIRMPKARKKLKISD